MPTIDCGHWNGRRWKLISIAHPNPEKLQILTNSPKRVRNTDPQGRSGKHKSTAQQNSIKQAHHSVRALFDKLSKLNPIPRVRAATSAAVLPDVSCSRPAWAAA